MDSSYFKIQEFQEDSYFVTILSTEMSSVYWPELEKALIDLDAREKTVYFDFILRNGISDRFYKSTIDHNRSIVLGIQKCQATSSLSLMADSFFAKNLSYIERSVLTKRQREIFYRTLEQLSE